MNICPNCGLANDPAATNCARCGAPIAAQPSAQPYPQPPAHPAPCPPAFVPTAMPPVQQPPILLHKKIFTWWDVCTVLGFVSSILGFFFASVALLPLGLITSVLGFRGDKTRGLAVAGIVISAVGLLIKFMLILNEAAFLPDWFTNGIW